MKRIKKVVDLIEFSYAVRHGFLESVLPKNVVISVVLTPEERMNLHEELAAGMWISPSNLGGELNFNSVIFNGITFELRVSEKQVYHSPMFPPKKPITGGPSK